MEIPEAEINIGIAGLLFSTNFFVEDEADLKPIKSQYEMGPGSSAILTHADPEHGDEFVVLRVLDAEKYKDEFPDWEERLMNSFLLCQWDSREDAEGGTGWFPRVMMIPVEPEQYDEMLGWIIEHKMPPRYPDWVLDLYEEFTAELAKQSPDKIPVKSSCSLCGSKNVEIHAVHVIQVAGLAGHLIVDGEDKFTTVSRLKHGHDYEAHLHCLDCNARGTLNSGEWYIDFPQ